MYLCSTVFIVIHKPKSGICTYVGYHIFMYSHETTSVVQMFRQKVFPIDEIKLLIPCKQFVILNTHISISQEVLLQ